MALPARTRPGPDETRARILEKSEELFRRLGFAKTAVADIAAELGMSPANVYRFFASKLDIAEALAKERREVEFKLYAAIVQRSDISAGEKLRTVLMDDALRIHDTSTEQPRIVEISDIIARERPDFWADSLAEERVYLREILNEGIAKGEFRPVQDVDKLADTIQSAIYKFRTPSFSIRMAKEDLIRDLGAVLEIILSGLAKDQARAS